MKQSTNYTVTPQTATVIDCRKALRRFEDLYYIAVTAAFGEEAAAARYKTISGELDAIHAEIKNLLDVTMAEALDNSENTI